MFVYIYATEINGVLIQSVTIWNSISSSFKGDRERERNVTQNNENSSSLVWNSFEESQNKTKPIRILFWTASYGKPFRYYNLTRPHRCITSNNRSDISRSDAVVFHLWDMHNLQKANLPKTHIASQKWFLYNMEPPLMTKQIGEFDGIFNGTISYRFDSDIFTPYGYLKARSQDKPPPDLNIAKGKTRLVAWFVSSCTTQSKRHIYVAELHKHIPIDIYGKCGQYQCKKYSPACYEMLKTTYKFYLAFENSFCMDYMTEKVWEYMRHDVVLVVLGAGNYARMLPKHSFIDARDFQSPAKLAAYLHHVAANDALYNAYFAWKKQYEVVLYKQYEVAVAMCDFLHKTKDSKKSTTRTGLLKWWDQCVDPKIYYKNMGIKV